MTTTALNDRIRNALAQQSDTDEALNMLLAAVRQKPFDAELRRLLITAYLEKGLLQEAAAAINEKNKFCGLKASDGNLIIKLHAGMFAGGYSGAVFDEFLANSFVCELTADTCVTSYTDIESVRKAVDKLIRYGIFDAAKEILSTAIKQTPSDPSLYRMYIRCLVEAGALAEAAAAANRKSQACGLDDADLPLLGRLHANIMTEGLRGSDVDEFMANAFVQQAAADNSVYCRFESLGDDCELGFVQRKLGQEPLGLLRFGSIPFPTLINLLNNSFANFAVPENCELKIVEMGTQSQYDLYDNIYKYQIHTFIVAEKTSDMPSVLAKFCARVQFLKRKLLDDLGDGEKIFVYKTRKLSDKEILQLSKALHRHGPNRLLVIQQRARTSDQPAPAIERMNDVVLKGYLDQFDVNVRTPSHLLEWKTLLDAALNEFPEHSGKSRPAGILSKAAMFIRSLRT
jgi:tetratricopeptide (TPR) repeat protein